MGPKKVAKVPGVPTNMASKSPSRKKTKPLRDNRTEDGVYQEKCPSCRTWRNHPEAYRSTCNKALVDTCKHCRDRITRNTLTRKTGNQLAQQLSRAFQPAEATGDEEEQPPPASTGSTIVVEVPAGLDLVATASYYGIEDQAMAPVCTSSLSYIQY